MSFARNFALGSQIAGDMIDTYRDTREKRDIRRVMDATPESMVGFNADDGAALARAAGVRGPDGRPLYQVEDNGRGGLQIRTGMAYGGADAPAGQDGQLVDPGTVTQYNPRLLTSYLGNRYEGELTPQRQATLRDMAVADVVARNNPTAGLRMRREAEGAERDAQRFGWEQAKAPLQQKAAEQTVRQGELTLADSERGAAWGTAFQDALKTFNSNPEQLDAAIPYVNGSQLITLGEPDKKTGLRNMSVVNRDGRAVFSTLTRAQQAQIFAAASTLSVDPTRSLEMLKNVNKELADAVARDNNLQAGLGKAGNDVVESASKMTNDKTRADAARAAASRAPAERPNVVQFTDAKGDVKFVDLSRVPVAADGTVQLPAGLKPARQPATLSDAQKIAYPKALEELSQMGDKATAGQVAAVAKRYGLPIELFGVGPGLPSWGSAPPAAPQVAPQAPAAPAQGVRAPQGRQVIGPLTPISVIRSEAQQGNPEAIKRLQQIAQDISDNAEVMYNTGTQ